MKIGIIGGTGLIGSHLREKLIERHYNVIVFTRKDTQRYKATKNLSFQVMKKPKAAFFENLDALINLSGEPILNQRWNKNFKRKLQESRGEQTKNVVEEILKCKNPPDRLINGSAIGFYGSGEAESHPYTEESPVGKGFLARLSELWEQPLKKLHNTPTKPIIIRIGAVLTQKGGALAKMLPVFQAGLGGIIGNGKQIMSWIHIIDATNAILFLLEKKQLKPIYNLTAPTPVSNSVFSKALAKCLSRPCFFPLPSFVLKILYGEGAEVLLKGQKVYPKNLLEDNFSFQYKNIKEALHNIFSLKSKPVQ